MAEVEQAPHSWWRTLSAGSLVLSCALFGRFLGIVGVGMATGRIDPLAENAAPRIDGFLLAMGVLGASLMGGLALLFFVRKRAPLPTLRLTEWNAKHLALGLLASLLLALVFDAARYAMTGDASPPWMDTYGAVTSTPLLALALVAVAPVFEECLFRGFLQPGLTDSKLGPIGTIAILAILFTLAHRPSDLMSALEPLAAGVLLGVVRHQTKSTTTCIAMHAFSNLLGIVTFAIAG